jgi:hypothetical protein
VPTPYEEFRAKLDAVLRQRDPTALRDFLVAQGEWDEQAATDPERALWLMIATSPALGEMKAEALRWLTNHGFTAEVDALSGRGTQSSRPHGRHRSHGAHGTRPDRHQRD